jgi:hypothetical protein
VPSNGVETLKADYHAPSLRQRGLKVRNYAMDCIAAGSCLSTPNFVHSREYSSLRDLLPCFLLREVDPYQHSLPTVWPSFLQIAIQDVSIPLQAVLPLLCSLLACSLPCSSHLNNHDTTRYKEVPLKHARAPASHRRSCSSCRPIHLLRATTQHTSHSRRRPSPPPLPH